VSPFALGLILSSLKVRCDDAENAYADGIQMMLCCWYTDDIL